ncbi:MAG TPA: gluconokinase [Blastocatellia bacterium]|jgi:gluconokinase|nr:gluconokinase [Blastocatellia bacterium]
MSTIAPHEAEPPLALALDVGTSSARAALYDSRGRQIENVGGRTHYQMTVTQDGGVEIGADELIEIICATVDECLLEAATHSRAGLLDAISVVGYSNFWHAMLGVDRDGDAVTPLYNWSDTRSAPDARALKLRLGVDWVHERCGVVPHASYYPAKILWLRRADPALASKVSRWVSIGEYLYSKIFGRMTCGVSMASGTGLFNPNRNDWDDEMLTAVGVGRDQLSPLAEEGEGLSEMRREFAERWPALQRAKWLPAVGDGAASNIGSGCFTRNLIAINVGTSGAMRVCWPAERVKIPKGLWCYRANRRYALIGGALSNGGDVYAWCKRVLRLGDDDQAIESQLAAMKADDHGLTALPFFSGERSTGWHGEARATFTGINLSADPIEILRASLESVCYRFAAIYERLRAETLGDTRIIASGGGILNSPVWTRMMADVIGVPVVASAVPEASSRGAAMLAMEAFGHIGRLGDLETPLGEVLEPNARDHELYLRGRARQERLYDLLIEKGVEKL